MGTRRVGYVAAVLLAAGLVAAGCGAKGDTASTGSGEAVAGGAIPAPAADAGKSGTDQGRQAAGGTGQQQPSLARAIVRTGSLSLESGDLQKVHDQVTDTARRFSGQIADEETGTDDDGRIDHATLVVKVPTASFDRVMDELKKLGTVKQVRQESADVTEQVVDVESRIATQRAGLARMRTLMAKANTIGEIVSVETELTRREADLESLLAKQKALAAQTDLATLTVTLDRPGAAPAPKKDHSGFLGGLSAGWDAFAATVKAVATAAGALLPFTVAGLLVAIPVWLLIRRRRTATTG